jgi:hypothetical protein
MEERAVAAVVVGVGAHVHKPPSPTSNAKQKSSSDAADVSAMADQWDDISCVFKCVKVSLRWRC